MYIIVHIPPSVRVLNPKGLGQGLDMRLVNTLPSLVITLADRVLRRETNFLSRSSFPRTKE